MPDLIELLSKEQNIGREIAETIFHILEEHHIFNQDSYLEDQNETMIDRRFSVKDYETLISISWDVIIKSSSQLFLIVSYVILIKRVFLKRKFSH